MYIFAVIDPDGEYKCCVTVPANNIPDARAALVEQYPGYTFDFMWWHVDS
jgi:hypothetical protein